MHGCKQSECALLQGPCAFSHFDKPHSLKKYNNKIIPGKRARNGGPKQKTFSLWKLMRGSLLLAFRRVGKISDKNHNFVCLIVISVIQSAATVRGRALCFSSHSGRKMKDPQFLSPKKNASPLISCIWMIHKFSDEVEDWRSLSAQRELSKCKEFYPYT